MRKASTRVLTGHLKEYPLSIIFGILRHRRETGRLLIDYPAEPGAFYFKGGKLVDAQVGVLKNIQAVRRAVNLPEAAFNFDPDIEPPSPSINDYQQEIVMGVVGCLDDDVTQNTEAVSEVPTTGTPATANTVADVPHIKEVLLGENNPGLTARAFGSLRRTSLRKRLLISALPLLLLVAVAPIVALTDIFGEKPPSAVAERPEPSKPGAEVLAPAAAENLVGPSGYSVEPRGDDQKVSVVETREKVKQPPRPAAPNKSDAEVATSPVVEVTASAAHPASTLGRKKPDEAPKVSKVAAPDGSTITVVTQVENGRVVEAYVANRRPGMEGYEASALRAARQRRFPPETKGSEKVVIKVGKQ